MKFRELFKEVTGLDPLTRTFTLAWIGLEFFCAKILKQYTIGVTPIKGYTNQRKQSNSAKAWLDIKQQQYRHTIVREYRYGPYFIDGMIEKDWFENNIQYQMVAFEYLGCYYHGCQECGFYDQKKLDEIEKKRQYLQRNQIKIEFIKSCEWQTFLETNETLK